MEHEIPEQIKQSINEIVELLKSGKLPEVIAKITFPKDHKVMNNWSHSNKLLAYIDWIYANTDYGKLTKEEKGKKFFTYLAKAVDEADYRGFQQWKKEKHAITKEETASYILGPLTSKGYHRYYTDGEERKYLARGEKAPEGKNEEKEEYTFIKGFKLIPVFDIKQTTGPALKYEKLKLPEFPFLDVAKDMGIKVIPKGFDGGYYGAFSQSENKIIICTPDEVTFFHELSHAVDNKLQKEKTGKGLMGGQHADQEVVAQFSANVLAHYLGREIKQTTAYTLKYLEHYAGDKYEEMLMKVMSRCEAVIDYITNYKQAKSPAVQNKEMSGGIKQEAEILADKKMTPEQVEKYVDENIHKDEYKQLDELAEHQDEMTTSDLQGAVSAIVYKSTLSEDEALKYVYSKQNLCTICKVNKITDGKKYCKDCIEQKQPEEAEYKKQLQKERAEHPTLPKETIETIVKDHKYDFRGFVKTPDTHKIVNEDNGRTERAFKIEENFLTKLVGKKITAFYNTETDFLNSSNKIIEGKILKPKDSWFKLLPKGSRNKGYNITFGATSGFSNTITITEIKKGWDKPISKKIVSEKQLAQRQKFKEMMQAKKKAKQ